MFKKNSFFKGYFTNSKTYQKNLRQTKIFFNSFLLDLKNNEIPLLQSYEKNYEYNFSEKTIKKFYKYKNIIVIGIGGSILGTKSVYSFLKKKIKKNVFFLDNLDPDLILKYKKFINKKNSCFIVVSKSGNTLETIMNLAAIESKNLLKNKLVFITEIAENGLIELANKYNAEVIEHKEFIGGRYSVLSETGMFPAKLMGLDIKKFKNLKSLIKNKNFVSSLIYNVAGIFTLSKKNIKNSILLNYDSSLSNLGNWYQQLVAESLGKKGKGINPILSFGPKDHHSLLQLYLDGPRDKFFTFFSYSKVENKKGVSGSVPNNMNFLKKKSLKFIINAQCKAIKKIFTDKRIPFREIIFYKKNETELGKIFTFFVLETILLSRLMKVNPFDQPAVEQIKKETRKILK